MVQELVIGSTEVKI